MKIQASSLLASSNALLTATPLLLIVSQRFMFNASGAMQQRKTFSTLWVVVHASLVLLSLSSAFPLLGREHTSFLLDPLSLLPSGYWDPTLSIPDLWDPTSPSAQCVGQPPLNPFLSAGAWSMTHFSSIAQSSSTTSFLNPQQHYSLRPSASSWTASNKVSVPVSAVPVDIAAMSSPLDGPSSSPSLLSDQHPTVNPRVAVSSTPFGREPDRAQDRPSSSSPSAVPSAVPSSLSSSPSAAPSSLSSSPSAPPSSLSSSSPPTYVLSPVSASSNFSEDPIQSAETISVSARSANAITTVDFLFAPSLIADPISLLYDNANRYIWGTSFTTTFRVDRTKPSLRIADVISHQSLNPSGGGPAAAKISGDLFHGAYSLLSNEDAYYSLHGNQLHMFGDGPSSGSEQMKHLWSVTLTRRSLREGQLRSSMGQGQAEELGLDDTASSSRSTGNIFFNLARGALHVFHLMSRMVPYSPSNGQNHTAPINSAETDAHGAPLIGRALCMLYDGTIVIVSQDGFVGTIKGSKAQGFYNRTNMINLAPDPDQPVVVSNALACDPSGGVYIVSNRYLHKVIWNGSQLSLGWSSKYSSASLRNVPIGRLGEGSGSTPTLMGGSMGNNEDDGLYVVITDDSVVMNVVVFDAMTGAEMDRARVDFNRVNISESSSEQSVLVVRDRLVVVNNAPRSQKLRKVTQWLSQDKPTFLKNIATVIPVALGDSPSGVHQFLFDFKTKKLKTTWVNREASIPNGVPSASCTDGLLYGIGRRSIRKLEVNEIHQLASILSEKTGLVLDGPGAFHGVWTLEGLSWETGARQISSVVGWSPALNSLYAATEIGPGEIVTGTLGGILRLRTWK